MIRRVLPLLLVVLVVACARDLETFEPPALTYEDRDPIRLAVGEVSIENTHRSTGEPPSVEHTLVLTPEVAVQRLLERRLEAIGGAGSVRATIVDAAVEEEALETESGIAGYLTTEASARLRGRLEVRVDRLDDGGEVIQSLSTTVSRTRAIPEDTPYVRRQEIAFELVRDLTDDLDAGLVANIQDNFASIIRP